jgi:hypothetical protein
VFTYDGAGKVSGNAATFDIRVTRSFSGLAATGAARFEMTFTQGETAFTCSSGEVTWTATRT